MAAGAIHTERTLMMILVAIETRFVRDALELDELCITGNEFPIVLPRVTFHAGNVGMLSFQLEACFCM